MIISKGTTLVSNTILYSRRDLYQTVPIASETAPYLRSLSRRGATTGSMSFVTPTNNTAWNTAEAAVATSNKTWQLLSNAAYDRMISEIGDVAQVGANIAEGKSTLELVRDIGSKPKGLLDGFRAWSNAQQRIVSSTRRLVGAARVLRKGDLRSFERYLRVKKRKEHPSVFTPTDKACADWWIKYWFGIKPLVNDVMTSLEVLTSPFPKGKIHGSAKDASSSIWVDSGIKWIHEVAWTTRVRQGCTIQVYNPNTFLRQSLGLSNFWSIGWEVLPFSFLADWVGNVSNVLGAISDLDGLEITFPYTSSTCKSRSRDILSSPATPTDASFTAVQTWRANSLTKPILRFALPKRLSVTRAATSVSLLLLLFT